MEDTDIHGGFLNFVLLVKLGYGTVDSLLECSVDILLHLVHIINYGSVFVFALLGRYGG